MLSYFDGKKALVIINPTSGKLSAKTHLHNITALFSTAGLETTVYTTRCRGDATDIARRRGMDFDIIVCRGGDGTFNETVNGVMQLEDRPLLGYIPAGSTNDLARTLCIPTDNQEAIDIILNGQPLWNDLGILNGEVYFAYTASCGAFTEVSYGTPQKLKNRMGHMAYFAAAPKAIKSVHPIPTRIKTAEGYEAEGVYALISVTNSISIAGMIKLHRNEVGLNDGKFELLLIPYPADLGAWTRGIANLLARQYHTEGVQLLHTAHVEFEFGELVPWTVDGEDGGAHRRVEIENVHNAIQIFRR